MKKVNEMKYKKLTAREIHSAWEGGKVRLGIFDNGHCLPEHFIPFSSMTKRAISDKRALYDSLFLAVLPIAQ